MANDGRRLGTVFLGLDQQDTTGDAGAFMHQYAIGYPNVHDAGNDIPRSYGATGVPETYFIDARRGRRPRTRYHLACPTARGNARRPGRPTPRRANRRRPPPIPMTTPVAPIPRRWRRNHAALIAAGLGALIAALAVVLITRPTDTTSSAPSGPTSKFAGPVFPAGLRASPFSLQDQDGNRRPWRNTADRSLCSASCTHDAATPAQ